MMGDVAVHFMIGLAGAGAGWFGSGFCRHMAHRLGVTGLIVLAESVLSVRLVG